MTDLETEALRSVRAFTEAFTEAFQKTRMLAEWIVSFDHHVN